MISKVLVRNQLAQFLSFCVKEASVGTSHLVALIMTDEEGPELMLSLSWVHSRNLGLSAGVHL